VTTTTAIATSRDGTTIRYRQLGSGPGLIILHGSMESSASHLELAEALAGSYTVYLPDRRGRGMSGPYAADYRPEQDVQDLQAVMDATGAQAVMGVSSGAVIALNAALALPDIHKLVAFEPALFLDAAEAKPFYERFIQQVESGDVAGSMVTGMKGAQMGPPIFNLFPNWLLRRLTAMAMPAKRRRRSLVTSRC
jgi:pimeloyl-ACP methyl ester carboxylesterase